MKTCRTVVQNDSVNLLKTWSGRRGSNPRRPAWENVVQLKIKN
jgi:hypothetical protein